MKRRNATIDGDTHEFCKLTSLQIFPYVSRFYLPQRSCNVVKANMKTKSLREIKNGGEVSRCYTVTLPGPN